MGWDGAAKVFVHFIDRSTRTALFDEAASRQGFLD